jgi:hypothetical protein
MRRGPRAWALIVIMDAPILYGDNWAAQTSGDIYIFVYRGPYPGNRYPVARMILGINLTQRLLWKAQKYPLKVTEIGDGFLRLGPYRTCRELNSVLTSLDYSPEQRTELLAVIASKSDDPILKANGVVISF